MLTVEEKLNHFSSKVLGKALEEKHEIIDKVEKQRKIKLETKELQLLQDAYYAIQNGLRDINKDKNELISKAMMESKRDLLKAREEILAEVITRVEEQLKVFQKSSDYKDYLIKVIEEGIKKFDGQEVRIILGLEDLYLKEEVESKTKRPVEVQAKQEFMLGGCLIFCPDKNQFLDLSFTTKLRGEKQEILKMIRQGLEQEGEMSE